MAYESYCWNVGTTSFRRNGMNAHIERQMILLGEFWDRPENKDEPWQDNPPLQERFYDYLKKAGFLSGDAPRPAKDARQKTSGLRELGLVDENRMLTSAGRALLEVTKKGDFQHGDNLLELSPDSDIYFRQFLKSGKRKGDWAVRPFVLFLWVMTQIDPNAEGRRVLAWNEFVYLLPLCVNKSFAQNLIIAMNSARKKKQAVDVESVILSVLMGRDNYKTALAAFVSAKTVSAKIICAMGMNRDGGGEGGKSAGYDQTYLTVYNALHKIVFGKATEKTVWDFASALGKLRGVKRFWTRRFFCVPANGRVTKQNALGLFRLELPSGATWDEEGFRTAFFQLVHVYKAMYLLDDYADLNRRFFRLSDVVVFRDGEVSLDPLAAAFAQAVKPWLADNAFCLCSDLQEDVPLEKIVTCPLPSKIDLVSKVLKCLPSAVGSVGDVRKVLADERCQRFKSFVQKAFTKDSVAEILEKMEDRTNDTAVQSMVTAEANIPTIFEYVVALAWYYVSDCPDGVLDYMNLSLGPDFLPKTHASGGMSDIEWKYGDASPIYSKHTLLIEVTMAEKESQRHLEMESVSRHLGKFLLANKPDDVSYCVFVTPHLDPNVVSVFRMYRNTPYYDSADASKKVDHLKIVPIDTKTLRTALASGKGYKELYGLFDDAYQSDTEPHDWCERLQAKIAS